MSTYLHFSVHPTLVASVKGSRFAFVCQALSDFVLLECFDLTLFFFGCSAVLPSSQWTQQPFIQMRMNNIFLSPLEAPDNALIEADKPLLIQFFFSWQIKSCHLLMVINYWYLADCKWCLCQGVKCLQFLSSHLPTGSFPHLVLNLKPNCREKQWVVGIWVCGCEQGDTWGQKGL